MRCGFLYLALCLIPTIDNAAQADPPLDVYARPQQLVDIGGRRLNLYRQMSSHPSFTRTTLSEKEEAFGAGSDQVDASKRSYGALPLIVLTSTTPDTPPDPSHPDPYFNARTKVVIAMHEETARLSSRGVNHTISNATHHIMLSKPRAVIDAVNEVVAAVRKNQSATRSKH